LGLFLISWALCLFGDRTAGRSESLRFFFSDKFFKSERDSFCNQQLKARFNPERMDTFSKELERGQS